MRSIILFPLTACSVAALLVACGGGGGGSGSASTQATTITGSAVKGPVEGATVTIKKASDGTVLGTTTTTTGGAYTLSVPYTGDVIVEISGGTYTDEATQAKTALAAPLKAVLNANGANVTGVVTPITTMAYSNAFASASTPVTASAFKTQAANLAAQFQLSGVDLTTTAPVVTGSTNAYGKALASLSKYMQLNNVNLNTLLTQSYKDAQFSSGYSAAYSVVVPGSNVTYTFNNGTATTTVTGGGAGGSDLTVVTNGTSSTVTGSGAGGGTGVCGVNAQGTINQTVSGQSFSVPVNLDVCVTGIATGSCTASNASLSQTLSGAQGLSGAVNLKYTYSAACAAGAISVALK